MVRMKFGKMASKAVGREAVMDMPVVQRDYRDQIRTTHKYSFISTASMVEFLERQGWEVEAGYAATRKNKLQPDGTLAMRGEQDTTKHVVEFKPANASATERELGGLEQRLYLVNSHDGSTGFELHFGFLRLVCMNGLCVGQELLKTRKRHVNVTMSDLERQLAAVAELFPVLIEQFKRLNSVRLTEEQTTRLVERAVAIRWGEKAVKQLQESGDINEVIRQMTRAVRRADSAGTAWTLFNVVQENLVSGFGKYRALRSQFEANRVTQELYSEVLKLVA